MSHPHLFENLRTQFERWCSEAEADARQILAEGTDEAIITVFASNEYFVPFKKRDKPSPRWKDAEPSLDWVSGDIRFHGLWVSAGLRLIEGLDGARRSRLAQMIEADVESEKPGEFGLLVEVGYGKALARELRGHAAPPPPELPRPPEPSPSLKTETREEKLMRLLDEAYDIIKAHAAGYTVWLEEAEGALGYERTPGLRV